MAYTPSERATAVGRVLAGESRRKVASEMGVSDATVRRWIAKAEGRETAQAMDLAKTAQKVAEEISYWQDMARYTLIRRIVELAPESRDLEKVASAFAKVTDKALLAKGQPTSITQNVDRMDSEIDRMMREMAERELAGANRNGSG